MVAVLTPGPHFTDPRFFYRSYVLATGLFIVTHAAAATTASTAAGFFTEMALRGLSDDTNWTASTYKTLLSVTGAGLVTNLVGPTGLAGTPTTTFEITVDGVLTEVAVTATTTGYRACLGAMSQGLGATAGAFFTSAKAAQAGADAHSADKSADQLAVAGGSVIEVPSHPAYGFLGTPGLVFRNSLLIRAKSSEDNSTTTNNERQSAVTYRIF